jgi:hypothetical protein
MLAFLALLAPPAASAAVIPQAAPAARTCPVAVAAVPVAAWYHTVWYKIERILGNRTGAIQFAFVGMLIALWIIWWKK